MKVSKSDWRGSMFKIDNIPSSFTVVQALLNHTALKGTRRGFHLATGDSSEQKKIICCSGAILWITIEELSSDSAHVSLYPLSKDDDFCLDTVRDPHFLAVENVMRSIF